MLSGLFSLIGAVFLLMLLAAGTAVLPAMFALFAVAFALWLVFAVLGLVFRILGAVIVWIVTALGSVLPLVLVGAGLAFAFGLALVPLVLPLLFVALIVWLVARKPRPVAALPPPVPAASR